MDVINKILSDELYSRKYQLEKELRDVCCQIEKRKETKRLSKIGKYYKIHFKGEDQIRFYKILDYIEPDVAFVFSIGICNNALHAFINVGNDFWFDEDGTEITEEEFYEQYNKALDIIRDRLNSECNNSG